jgi:hypothetical protein
MSDHTNANPVPRDVVNEDNDLTTQFNPTNHMVGVIDRATDMKALYSDLETAGFGRDDVRIWTGEEGAQLIDPWGNEHGPANMLKRLFQMTHVDFDIEHLFSNEALAGNYVVAVHADGDARPTIEELMKRYGARNLHYFGKATFEQIV